VGEATLDGQQGKHASARISVNRAKIDKLQASISSALQSILVPKSTLISSWTDDYPSGEMIFTGPEGTYRVFFEDQLRKLKIEHDGEVRLVDPLGPNFDGTGSPIWSQYQDILKEANVAKLKLTLCKR
jgi:hypothetical protein